jgi:hypothetical protein
MLCPLDPGRAGFPIARRSEVLEEFRRLLPRLEGLPRASRALAFGLPSLDTCAADGSAVEDSGKFPPAHRIRRFYTSYSVKSAVLAIDKTSYIMVLSSNQRTPAMARKRRDWQAQVKGILKAELKRRNLSYATMAERLAAVGVKDNERNISNKISRGTFTAVFFMQCMEAIGVKTIHLEDA